MSGEPSTIPLTRREALWLGCRTKRCCCAAFVMPTGHDIWRIARALQVPPWSFLVYLRAEPGQPEAFRLAPDGPWYRLALAHRPGAQRTAPAACTFLLRLRTGVHRCGLGERRPGVCRLFPLEPRAGLLRITAQTGCTCRRWTLADCELTEESALVAAVQAERRQYFAFLDQWNERIQTLPAAAPVDFLDFCRALLSAYDDLASGRRMEDSG